MNTFPVVVRAYIWAIIGAGALAFAYAFHGQNWASLSGKWYVALILFVVTGASANYKVLLFGKPGSGSGQNDSGTTTSYMSLGFVPTLFTLLYFGLLAGMGAGAVSVLVTTQLVTTRWKKRTAPYQIVFSVAVIALSVLVAAVVLRLVGLADGDMASIPLKEWQRLVVNLPIVYLATLAYYLVNTFCIATALALTNGQRPLSVWRENFLWAGPGYFAGAGCAAVIFALAGPRLENRSLIDIVSALVLIAPMLWVTFYLFKVYMDKIHANEQHIEELEQGKRDMEQLYRSTVESLALAIEAKDLSLIHI